MAVEFPDFSHRSVPLFRECPRSSKPHAGLCRKSLEFKVCHFLSNSAGKITHPFHTEVEEKEHMKGGKI